MRRQLRQIVAALVAVLALSSTAVAQTRVRVVRDRATIWLPGFVAIGTVVSAGTELEARVKRGDWYEVLFSLPGSVALQAGMIAANQVEVMAGGTVPVASATARPGRGPQAASARVPGVRGPNRFSISIGAQRSNAFTSVTTLPQYLETALYDMSYPSATMPTLDIAGAQFRGHFGIGAGISYASARQSVPISGSIPHPFFYGTPRLVDGSADGLERRETALHVQALVGATLGHRLEIAAGAGPSFFHVRQDLLSSVAFTEEYPYDTAVFGTASTAKVSASKWGFNAGADATFWLSPNAGIGAVVKYSRASLDFARADQPTVTSDAGGLFVGGGIRISF